MNSIAAEDLLVDPYPNELQARREARGRVMAAGANPGGDRRYGDR